MARRLDSISLFPSRLLNTPLEASLFTCSLDNEQRLNLIHGSKNWNPNAYHSILSALCGPPCVETNGGRQCRAPREASRIWSRRSASGARSSQGGSLSGCFCGFLPRSASLWSSQELGQRRTSHRNGNRAGSRPVTDPDRRGVDPIAQFNAWCRPAAGWEATGPPASVDDARSVHYALDKQRSIIAID